MSPVRSDFGFSLLEANGSYLRKLARMRGKGKACVCLAGVGRGSEGTEERKMTSKTRRVKEITAARRRERSERGRVENKCGKVT